MKIIIGGAMHKEEIAQLVKQHLPEAEVSIKSDLEGAMAVKNKEADYYLGACDTGAGGSLGMAIALLGASKCKTLAMPGKVFSEEEIAEAVKQGIIAFGFTHQTKEYIVSTLAKYLK